MPYYMIVFGDEDIDSGIVMGVREANTPQEAITECAREAITDELSHELTMSGAVGTAEWILNGAVDDDTSETEQDVRIQQVIAGDKTIEDVLESSEHHYTAFLLASDDFNNEPATFTSTELEF